MIIARFYFTPAWKRRRRRFFAIFTHLCRTGEEIMPSPAGDVASRHAYLDEARKFLGGMLPYAYASQRVRRPP